jgi:hypothetical protein
VRVGKFRQASAAFQSKNKTVAAEREVYKQTGRIYLQQIKQFVETWKVSNQSAEFAGLCDKILAIIKDWLVYKTKRRTSASSTVNSRRCLVYLLQ